MENTSTAMIPMVKVIGPGVPDCKVNPIGRPTIRNAKKIIMKMIMIYKPRKYQKYLAEALKKH
jgi:hypothetical protein